MAVNRLDLVVRRRVVEEHGEEEWLELAVLVDGEDVFEPWGGMGRVPDDLLDPELPLLPPADGSPVVRAVQRCGCGEVGCGSIRATIRRDGDHVTWTELMPEGFGPFCFDAAQYDAEVRRAHEERPWEGRAARIARLVGYELRDGHRPPFRFDWASTDRSDRLVVSFTLLRPNPRAGERRQMAGFPPGWLSVEDDHLFEQHIGTFPIPDGGEDAAVRALVEAIEASDPRSWRSPWR